MRSISSLALMVVLCLPAVTAAQPVTTFTLEEVQRLALGRYEAIAAAGEQVQQAEWLRRQAGAVVWPTVSVGAVTTRNLVTGSFTFGGRQIDVLPGADYNLVVTVTQPIYAGLRDFKVRDQADLGIEIAETELRMTRQDAVLEATRAHYAVLGAQDNVEISRRAVEVAAETLRTAESLYRAGEAVETAVLRARVAQSEAQRELLQAQNGLELAKQQLALLVDVGDEITVSRPERPTGFGKPLADLIATGLASRVELKAIGMQQQVAELEIEKRRGQYLPVVRAEATYLRRRSDFPSNQLSSVSINASWTVFEGGRIAAEVAAGQSELRELQLRADLLRKQTTQQIRAAYLNVDTLAASVDMLTAQVEFARRNADATARAFRVGEATDLDLLEAPGTFFPDEEAVVSSEATGVVIAVRVEEGTRVRRGEELVRLDETKARLGVQQAEAALAQARANFEKTKSELARKAMLLDDRTIAPATFDTFKAQHDTAAAAVDAAEAALALARQQLADLTVVAPFAGVIKDTSVAEGEYVRPGDRLLTLMRVDPLKLIFDLPEKHAARVREGTAVEARVAALPGETFRGGVRIVFPAVAIESRTVRVEARVANPSYRLKPGYYAGVRVPLHSLPDSLVVPRGAVTTREGAEHVLAIEGDRVTLVRVQTGVETAGAVEIVAGLADDVRVVVSDVEALQPGDRVRASGAN